MPESTPIAISVRNVTFGYTRHDTVLDHVGFGVPHGQSLAVLGYNGVGKTTLFRIITGLLRPRSGEAIVNADVIHGMRDVFMLSADGALATQLSLRENIAFRAKLFDHGHIAIDRRIADFPDFDTFKAAMTIDEPHPAVSFGFNEERSHRS